MAEPSAALTYTSYLALDEVLGAQRPKTDEHDELLFIVIHQVYELWFKQLLHELVHLQARLEAGGGARALGAGGRAAGAGAGAAGPDDPQDRRRADRRARDDDAEPVRQLPRAPGLRQRLSVGAVPRARGRAGAPRRAGAVRVRGGQPGPRADRRCDGPALAVRLVR